MIDDPSSDASADLFTICALIILTIYLGVEAVEFFGDGDGGRMAQAPEFAEAYQHQGRYEGGDSYPSSDEKDTLTWYAMQLAKKRTIVIGPTMTKYAPDEDGFPMPTDEEYDEDTPFEELDELTAVKLMPSQGEFVDDEGMQCIATHKPVAHTPEYQALLEGRDAERKETANSLDDDRDKDGDE